MAIKQRIGQSKQVEASPEAAPTSAAPRKRVCQFCEQKKLPTYTDTIILKKYISDRAKILPKARNGNCSKHQRLVTKHIKYARHLALLPFVAKV